LIRVLLRPAALRFYACLKIRCRFITLDSLIDILGTLIEDYENKNVPEPVGDPISSLKHFMEEHNLKQSDLSEIGSQGVASEILNGKGSLISPKSKH
jgi:antitoxin component HigA of HigAB toxin-antitoxin module